MQNVFEGMKNRLDDECRQSLNQQKVICWQFSKAEKKKNKNSKFSSFGNDNWLNFLLRIY